MCVCDQLLSRVRLSVTPQTVTHQAPLSMGFSRHECWSGLLFPPHDSWNNPHTVMWMDHEQKLAVVNSGSIGFVIGCANIMEKRTSLAKTRGVGGC